MSLDVYLEVDGVEVWSANITHNMARMAGAAHIYTEVWLPEECGITKASQLVPTLQAGIALMVMSPDEFIKHNPENGWGSYTGFVKWLLEYMLACKKNPDAMIRVSR